MDIPRSAFDALRALNETAYVALRKSEGLSADHAARLRELATTTDALVDGNTPIEEAA